MPPITPPPDVQQMYRDMFADRVPPPNPGAFREIFEHLGLVMQYNGELVGCAILPDESLAVVAVGVAEIEQLLAGLTDLKRSRILLVPTAEEW